MCLYNYIYIYYIYKIDIIKIDPYIPQKIFIVSSRVRDFLVQPFVRLRPKAFRDFPSHKAFVPGWVDVMGYLAPQPEDPRNPRGSKLQPSSLAMAGGFDV